jgi:hypothetical protein
MKRVSSFLLLASLLLCGCGAVDNMSGVGLTKELQKTGVSATAVILKISDTGMTVNDDPVALLDLEVHPENGEPFQAKTKCLIPRLHVSQFQQGHTVPVRYDPKNHSRVAVDAYNYN